MTGLRSSHARTCAHAFAYFRAAEPVPSLLSSLLNLSGLIQGFAREKGLFRGLFRLCRFFLFLSTRRSPKNFKSARRAPPLCQLLIRHTSYVTTILTAFIAPFSRLLPFLPLKFLLLNVTQLPFLSLPYASLFRSFLTESLVSA
jgi:hypothetical protein